MHTQKLSTLEKVGFGAGDMALNVVISSMMLIITFFYTDIYGLKTTDLALLFVAELLHFRFGRYVAVLFIFAMAMLTLGFVAFMIEVRLSLRATRIRRDLILPE